MSVFTYSLDKFQSKKVRKIAKNLCLEPLVIKYRKETFSLRKNAMVAVYPSGAGPLVLKTDDNKYYDVLEAILKLSENDEVASTVSLPLFGLAGMIAIRERGVNGNNRGKL